MARFPDVRRRLNAHCIFQLQFLQAGAELTVHAIGCVCQNHLARNILLHRMANLIERYSRLGLELNLLGNACLAPSRVIAGPRLGW